MSENNPTSVKRGAEAIRRMHLRQLLRVEGVTYTVDELAAVVGKSPEAVRRCASKLVHARKPYTLDDFRG